MINGMETNYFEFSVVDLKQYAQNIKQIIKMIFFN